MLLTPWARAYVFSFFAVLPALIFGLSSFCPVWMINRRKDQVWYERARYVFPFRRAIGILFGVELFTGYFLIVLVQSHLGLDNDPWFFPLGLCGLVIGTFYSLYLIHRRTGGECKTFGSWLAEFGAILMVRLFFGVVMIIAGYFLSQRLSYSLAWSIAWVIGYLFSLTGAGLKLLGLMRMLQPAPHDLIERCNATALQLGVPPPREVMVLKHRHANAFALPLLKKIIVTSKLLTELAPAEVDSVLAHEIGHLAEKRSDAVKRVLIGLTCVPGLYCAVFNIDNLPVLLGSLLATYLILLQSGKLSQRLEKRADEFASRGQHSPGEYAEALLKLYRCNLAPAVFRRKARRTHPDLYDRMIAAGTPPPFARPLPPVRLLFFFPFTLAVMLNALLIAGFFIAVPEMPRIPAAQTIQFEDQSPFDGQDQELKLAPENNRPDPRLTPI